MGQSQDRKNYIGRFVKCLHFFVSAVRIMSLVTRLVLRVFFTQYLTIDNFIRSDDDICSIWDILFRYTDKLIFFFYIIFNNTIKKALMFLPFSKNITWFKISHIGTIILSHLNFLILWDILFNLCNFFNRKIYFYSVLT